MINRRLSTAEVASRLGIKPATVYAYVSRGLLHPLRGPGGSTFDRQEVAALARTARRPARNSSARLRRDHTESGPENPTIKPTGSRRLVEGNGPGEPVFMTELTLIEAGHLYYRGRDAVELSRRWRFEQAAEWLWTGRESDRSVWPAPGQTAGGAALGPAITAHMLPVERLMVATVSAALNDDLRHDLDPVRVPVTGRRLLAALGAALPLAAVGSPAAQGGPAEESMADRVWRGLTRQRPTSAGREAVDAALVLAADHELAPSTLAARVAASFRADPYAVVLTGLGPAGGSWPAGSTGAPGEVEILLERAAAVGAEKAIGEHLRRAGQVPHGFGMPLYPDGDPRGQELLSRMSEVGPPGRRRVVEAVLDVGQRRGFPPPNFDLGLGALSFCAGMVAGAGQALFTLGKVAGWLAHAMEEYAEPTRFRSRADYVGTTPDGSSGSAETGSSGSPERS